MKKIYSFALFICLAWQNSLICADSKIVTTASLNTLERELSTFDDQTLVIFDRDDTLLQGIETMEPGMRKAFVVKWLEVYSSQQFMLAHNNLKPTLIDPQAPSLINALRKKGAKVIILTRGCHGSDIMGRSVEDICIEAFKSVAIDLSESFNSFSGSFLESINYKGYYPLFKSGIIFSNGCDKGKTLEAFLAAINWYPTHIIFIDDRKPYVQEVQEAAQRLKIQFLGLVYTGAYKLTPPDIDTQCQKMGYLLARELVSA